MQAAVADLVRGFSAGFWTRRPVPSSFPETGRPRPVGQVPSQGSGHARLHRPARRRRSREGLRRGPVYYTYSYDIAKLSSVRFFSIPPIVHPDQDSIRGSSALWGPTFRTLGITDEHTTTSIYLQFIATIPQPGTQGYSTGTQETSGILRGLMLGSPRPSPDPNQQGARAPCPPPKFRHSQKNTRNAVVSRKSQTTRTE